MPNIYLKVTVTIEKNWRSQNLVFLSLKNSSPGQIFEHSKLTQISLDFKTSCYNLKTRGLEAKACVAFLLF